MSDPVIGYYLVDVDVTTGMPGAPVLHMKLGVHSSTGQVQGSGEITQALPPPHGITIIPQITGQIFHTGFGQDLMLVHLTGEYFFTLPPPAIGTITMQFAASLIVDKAWDGEGSFTYGNHTYSPCKVTKVAA